MAEPKTIASTGQIVTGQGVIEIISLEASATNSGLIIYDGIDNTGRRMWDVAVLANTSKDTPNLDLPYTTGIYAVISGANAIGHLTLR